ncbi:HNH endonuclease [Desulfotignum balticum]|jgi:DNA-directed RNA polymerase subunit RPC12/RpoP|uniref:HNH endonuclease n=1 Tax=Desulfotignum balticum TaxID=115781 RepID=UPI0004624EC2|nr:HNH endonuclease signature motif containing protein [Desulfotignum balticum]
MLRKSFLPPIPEFELAASLLAQAADALIANELHLCEKFIREADLRALREFSYLVTGPINPKIHRQSKNPVYDPIPKNKLPRMPNAEVTKKIFLRDGYRCRFCGSRVILKQAQKKFISLFPNAARWGKTNEDKHFGLSTITASIDHIIPYKRGGTNDKNNLVTACGPCQFGRNQWLLEEVEIEDPRNHAPIMDDWDGLARIIKYKFQS